MIAQVIDILFEPEVHWTIPLRPSRRRSGLCLLPWICLAFAGSRRRSRRYLLNRPRLISEQ